MRLHKNKPKVNFKACTYPLFARIHGAEHELCSIYHALNVLQVHKAQSGAQMREKKWIIVTPANCTLEYATHRTVWFLLFGTNVSFYISFANLNGAYCCDMIS